MKVLVLHAPALHLGFLGCYGNTWIETPNLDRFASEAVVFDGHHADCPSVQTCWTGRFGAAPAEEMLPALLTRAGISWIAVDSTQLEREADATPLETTLDAAVTALEEIWEDERWLCWVDLPSLAPPWEVPAGFTARYLADDASDEGEEVEDERDDQPLEPLLAPPIGVFDRDDLLLWERLRCTYAGAVGYLDAGLGLLFDELRARSWLDEMLVIVTAPRGLALGEHGIVGDCRPWLHDELVHLPLLVRQPKAADAGRRIFALTQPVDVAATLLDHFGLAIGGLDGRSWLPLLRNEVLALREHCLSYWRCQGAEERSLRTLEWALLLPADQEDRAIQLYAKPEDRWEQNNVLQHHQELAEELQKLIPV